MAIRARARMLFSGLRSGNAPMNAPDRAVSRGTWRVVTAMGLGAGVALVSVALALDGLDLPLALYLPLAIAVGAVLMVANGWCARPKARARPARPQELMGLPPMNGADTTGRRPGLRFPVPRFLVAVALAFVIAECATMTVFDDVIATRVIHNHQDVVGADFAGAPDQLQTLRKHETELTAALGRTVDDDPAVVASKQELARLDADLAATELLLPCGSASLCPARFVTRLGRRDDLRARRDKVGAELQSAVDHFRSDHAAQFTLRNTVQGDVLLVRSGYYDAIARLVRGDDLDTTSRIQALVAVGNQRIAVSVLIPALLFVLGVGIDFGGLWLVARRRSGA